MPSRHKSRQRALQVLYQQDIGNHDIEDAIRGFYDSLYTSESPDESAPRPESDGFMEELARGAARKRADIDANIVSHSEHWRLERMPAVDRNLLRMAVYEMTVTGTPPPVVIDEALDLARRFSGEESVPFINGVLDAVRRDLEASSATEQSDGIDSDHRPGTD
ncbi:MAG: transcription antitermination factor NusB [Candidatus Solibacter usitatus]|nr:transcription antitermination factor NusB [Candidatus Solibacter usitatus]